MDVKIQFDPSKDPELYERLLQVSKTFEEIVGRRGARFVTAAELSPFMESGPLGPKHAIRLKMTDRFSGTVEDSFQPAELRSPDSMKTRLREVWSKFLRQLSDEQMDHIDELMKTVERD